MEKEDARNQTLEQRHEQRKQVARLHKKGVPIMQIVPPTGVRELLEQQFGIQLQVRRRGCRANTPLSSSVPELKWQKPTGG